MTFDPGTRIHERYVIEALIGSGMASRVYRAADTKLGRPVAVKILHLADAHDEEDAPRTAASALREARAGAAIHHVNVPAVFDVDEVDGCPFIVMELVSGSSLRAHVGAPEPLGLRLRWLADVASALDAAHRLDVVHRDVKPENVIVGHDGQVKVLDFGVARRLRAAALDTATQSADGGVLGTPAYMSPEQIRGERVDARSDQFSWGTVAYELLAGALPWRSPDQPVALLASILRDTPAPFAPELGIPGEVEATVLRALAAAPPARFPSMAEVASALSPFAAAPVLFAGVPAAPSTEPPREHTSERFSSPPGGSLPLLVFTDADEEVDPLEETMAASLPGDAGATPRPATFVTPSFHAPVDVEARIALLPWGATCKGMVFQDLLRRGTALVPASELFRRAGVAERRYVAFRDYPMEENLRLLVAVAGVVHRGVPLGEALRRMGQGAFDMILGTHVGRTLLGVFGRDLAPVLANGVKVYGILMSFGVFTCEKTSPGRFLVRFKDYPAFVDTYEVGAAEGVLRHCGKRGRVRVRVDRLDDMTIEIELEGP